MAHIYGSKITSVSLARAFSDVSTRYTALRAIGVTHHGRLAEPVEARLPVYDLKLPPAPSSLVILSVMFYKVVRAIAVGRVSRT